jgi:hypothetical protein
VNNVNVTNTSVSVTRITNVYNTTIVNRSTTINNITYVNQHVKNGVTVVSHDAFVHARPVAQNVMKVEPRELAAAPVTHAVAAEPVRASVAGAGRPASVRPPAAVMSRPVVAVRTPPPPPRPIEQRQAQTGGHLNQQALVHPMGAAQPASTNQGGRPVPSQNGFRQFTQANSGNSNNGNVRPIPNSQPRVYEQQGTSQPDNRNVPPSENHTRYAQPENRPQQAYRPQQQEARTDSQPAHPLVRPAPPVQERNPQQEQQQQQKFNQWHEQRPAAPPAQQREPSRPSPPKQENPPKKSR